VDSRLLEVGILFGLVGTALVVRGLRLAERNWRNPLKRRPRSILVERLGKKSEETPAAAAAPADAPAEKKERRRNLLPRLTDLLTKTRAKPILAQIDHALILARIPLKAVEFLYISSTALFIALLVIQFFTSNVLLALGVTLVAGFAPFYVLRISQQLRFTKIDFQVADALLLMTNSLRSGTSFMDAMDAVSREMPPPISDEFARSLRDVTLGVPVDEAFVKMSQRCHSEDLDLAVTAFMIQREVGGNLAEILENIAETIRMRMKLKQEIKTLTAQGKLSGGILCLLPIGLTGMLSAMNPQYMDLLFTTQAGKAMLWVGGALQVVGILAISRIVKIEV
jgi:tight adherence protein B